MSIDSHLAELERRHEALKREIQEARSHPSFDDLELAALKRRKLQVKDQIAKIRASEDVRHLVVLTPDGRTVPFATIAND